MAQDPIQELRLEDLRGGLRPRDVDAHKGDFGSIGIIGGAPGTVGAALLAGRSALLTGAGRVFVGLLDERVAVDPQMPELMIAAPERVLAMDPPGCLVMGPGLGQSKHAEQLMREALMTKLPLVIDADGLNLLSRDARLRDQLREREPGMTLLTPHPMEAARLLESTPVKVQADRPRAIHDLVHRFDCAVILKGAGTLILAPRAALLCNPTGNPGMASAGMGDVLSGLLAAQCGQGMDLLRAAQFSVYLHGAAADAAVAAGLGPVGLVASEVAAQARILRNQWLQS